MEANRNQTFNKRSFNVLVMLFAFSLLPLSGIMIHQTHGLSERDTLRHFAMSVHNFSAAIFLATSLIHIIVHRKTIWRNITNKTSDYFRLKKEVFAAVAIVFGLVGLFAMHAFHV